ncbi:hypothetical protein HPC49_29425 [Pyxidicoccus fallax]|nr:hypothetical protein [Pyxidicoccus fallax]
MLDFSKAGWLVPLVDEAIASASAPSLEPTAAPLASGRARARAYLRRTLRASGLLYGTPADVPAPVDAAPPTEFEARALEEQLFRAVVKTLTRLALAGALAGLCGSRRKALWEIQALGPLDSDDLFFGMSMDGTEVELPSMSVFERVVADYDTVGLSLEKHPLELLRPTLKKLGAVTAEGLKQVRSGRPVTVGGMLICRQRPPTAKGICFISLEDETGIANLIVPPDVYERCRKEIHGALFIVGQGVLERSGKVTNVKTKLVSSLSQ